MKPVRSLHIDLNIHLHFNTISHKCCIPKFFIFFSDISHYYGHIRMTTKHSATHLVSSMFFLHQHKYSNEPSLNRNATLMFYLKKKKINLQSPTGMSLILFLFVLVFSLLRKIAKATFLPLIHFGQLMNHAYLF